MQEMYRNMAACVKGLLETHFLWVSKKESMPSSHTCACTDILLMWLDFFFKKKVFEQVQQANNGP